MHDSTERQLNQRINSLKQFMSNALGTNDDDDSIMMPTKKTMTTTMMSSASSSSISPRLTSIKGGGGSSSIIGARNMTDHTSLAGDTTTVTIETSEWKKMKDKNQQLTAKVIQLEDLITSYSAKLQLCNEQVRDYEHKLNLCRQELDSEVDRRRSSERSLKEQLRATQHKLEETQAEYDVLQQKERITAESRKTMEDMNKELEKHNSDKTTLISELQKELNRRKMERSEMEVTITELRNERKHLEEDLVTERRNRERDVNEIQNELIQSNRKSTDNIKKIMKEKEKERAKYDQSIAHFQTQIATLENHTEALKKKLNEMQVENSHLLSEQRSMEQRERYFTKKVEALQDEINEQKTKYNLLHQNHVQLLRERESVQASEKRLEAEMQDRISQLLAKLKFAEDQNAILTQKNLTVQKGNSSLYEKLREQNELLRSNVEQLQKDKDILERMLQQERNAQPVHGLSLPKHTQLSNHNHVQKQPRPDSNEYRASRQTYNFFSQDGTTFSPSPIIKHPENFMNHRYHQHSRYPEFDQPTTSFNMSSIRDSILDKSA